MIIGITAVINFLFIFWMFTRWSGRSFPDSMMKLALFVLSVVNAIIAIAQLLGFDGFVRLFAKS